MSYLLPPITNPRRQFEFEIKLLADSLSFGGDASRYLGSGLEYAQSRKYEPGDPVKLIDWRVTARTGKTFVKEYEAARQVPIYLAVDTSASMCVGSVERNKYYWAVRLAAGIGQAGLERLSPVGLIAGGERDLRVTPTLSSQSLLQWAEQLRQFDFQERTQLSTRLRTLAASLKQRSIVFVLSDLHDEGSLEVMELLATNHELVVLWLQDPAEVKLPRGGIFRAREAETGVKSVLHGWTKLSTSDRIRESLVQSGIEFLHIPIDEPVLPRVRYFLKHRKSLGHD
jgi:uncharacterized protein (DUF58 family)